MCLQLKSGVHLCRVGGSLSPQTCSRCHEAHYQSKEHHTPDWRWGHKQACRQSEFEIVIRTEDEVTLEDVEKGREAEITGSMGEAPDEELDSMAKHEPKEDKNSRSLRLK